MLCFKFIIVADSAHIYEMHIKSVYAFSYYSWEWLIAIYVLLYSSCLWHDILDVEDPCILDGGFRDEI